MAWTTGVTTGATMAAEFNDVEADLASLISSLLATIDGRIALANLDDLVDVTLTSPAINSVLTFNGTEWIDQAPPTGVTNLSYTAATRVLASDTGTDATLPLVGSDPGLMSAADKTKLDGVAAGATANSADATLLARANHTGSQASSTISDFAEAVDDRVAALIVGGTNMTVTYNDALGTLTFDAAGGGAGTNLSYDAATRVLASDTGADATLPLMSSGNAGLVPASGGGTTNFLRADGAFAAPPSGSAPGVIAGAPAADQANWSPAGFGSTVGTIKLQPTTNSFLTGLVAGATDQEVTLVNDSDFVVCIEGESGASTAANRFRRSTMTMWLLPHEAMRFRYSATLSRWVRTADTAQVGEVNINTTLILPNTTTSVQSMGRHAATTTATISTIGPLASPTNEFDELAVTQGTNSTAAGTSSIRGQVVQSYRGATSDRQGFFHAGMVKFPAMGNATGAVRAGMLSSTSVSTTLNSALTSCLLIGAETAQTTLRIVHNDGSGAATQVDLGADFPVPSATASYEYCFYAKPNTAAVQYMVRRLDSRFVAQGTLTTDLPGTTVNLALRVEVMVGATAVANTFQMSYLLLRGL